MGDEKKFRRQEYADMLTNNLDKICEIASRTNGRTNMPYALMGYTPEQCEMAEQFVQEIRQAQKEQAREDFLNRLKEAEAKYRSVNLAKKFFKRHPRNASARIEIDEPTVIMLGNIWKADLNSRKFQSDDFGGFDVPTDIVWAGEIALPDVQIDFPVYLDCATGDENAYRIGERAKVTSVRFIMRDDYQKKIQKCEIQEVFADALINIKGTDYEYRPYEFTLGTELLVRKNDMANVFYNDKYALKGRVPGRLMGFMAERLLVYYTAVWYSIMLAYLHPLTVTSIVDVGKRMAEEYAHNPVQNRPPLKNIRYLKLDGNTLEKVLYHSKPGKGRKYERHCQLWPVRGYMRKNGTFVAPQWRGPLAKMKRLSEDIESRQRKIVGVSLDADEKR